MKHKFRIILTHGASVPQRTNHNDAGMDLKARGIYNPITKEEIWFNDEFTEYHLNPNQRILVKTGVQVAIPDQIITDEYGLKRMMDIQVRARSGLALKEGIMVLNAPGTVDNGYRNDIGVILHNSSDKTFVIKANDRIAQMIISESIITDNSDFEIVDNFDDSTTRDMSGFGSSGVK